MIPRKCKAPSSNTGLNLAVQREVLLLIPTWVLIVRIRSQETAFGFPKHHLLQSYLM
jgi:hypothetical protein